MLTARYSRFETVERQTVDPMDTSWARIGSKQRLLGNQLHIHVPTNLGPAAIHYSWRVTRRTNYGLLLLIRLLAGFRFKRGSGSGSDHLAQFVATATRKIVLVLVTTI